MNAAFVKLAYYFGPVGMASVGAWLAAVAAAVLFILFWRRTKVCAAALVLAVAGLVLSLINSNHISAIQIDFSEELRAAQHRATSEEEQPTEPDENEPQGDYRQRGKVDRAEGTKVAEKISVGLDTEDRPVQQNVRTLKMHEVEQANRLDRLNLFGARWTLYLAIFLVVFDYFRRFNKPLDSYMPLPLGGWLVDSLFPKSHIVRASGDVRMWKQFLRQAVRKGETFIYFGGEDPWPATSISRLPRFIPMSWRLDKVTRTSGGGNFGKGDFDDEFLFESAWFGRYCFVLTGGGPAALEQLNRLADFLELRRQTRASAAHTVNVLWDLDSPIPQDTLDRLLTPCGETNFRLILATPALGSPDLA